MSTKVGQAVENFKNGFNCTQAVLDPYCEQLDLLLPLGYSIKRIFV